MERQALALSDDSARQRPSGPAVTLRPALPILVIDDGSALANSVVAGLDPVALNVSRLHLSEAHGKVLASRCHDVSAVAFITDGWEEGAVASASSGLDNLFDQLRGSGKRLVYVSEASVVGDTGTSFGNEDSPRSSWAPHPWQSTAEAAAIRAISTGVHSVVIRRTLVHGRGAGALLQRLIEHAKWTAEAVFVGDGSAATSTVHIDDLTRLIQTSLIRAPQGAVYMAASEEVISWRKIAELVGTTTDPPSRPRSASVSEADTFGLDGRTMAINNVIVDDGPHRRLGWLPHGPSLADELAATTALKRSAPLG